ncbi:MAG: class I SAM-dependent methyltransferase [Solirubrobacterales bacterium]
MHSSERELAYRAALARIHDDGFGFIARGAAKMLVAGLELQHLRDGVVVELACGSGISSRMIADAGYEIVGFDISPDMIEIARARVPEARFEVCSLYDAELPDGCVAVTAVGEAFNYLFDPRAGFEAMLEVFVRAHAALAPGGIFLFDVAQPGRAMPRLEHTAFSGDGWEVSVEVVEDPATRTLERRMVSRTGPGLSEQDTEIHRLDLYDHEEVFAALREAGFDPATLPSYAGDYRFSVGHGGFYAVKA